MKAKLWITCIALMISLSFCFIVYAEYKNETVVKSNPISVEKTTADEVDIDWVDTLNIQWCEYPFAE